MQRECVADPLHRLREPAPDRERTESLREPARACSSHRERGRGFTKVEEAEAAEEEEDEEEDEEEERLFKANRRRRTVDVCEILEILLRFLRY